MAKFERGDIVVYEHIEGGAPERNGSLGVVTGVRVDEAEFREIRWLLGPLATNRTSIPHSWNLRKIGHIEVPEP